MKRPATITLKALSRARNQKAIHLNRSIMSWFIETPLGCPRTRKYENDPRVCAARRHQTQQALQKASVGRYE